MGLCQLGGEEETGGLDYDVGIQGAPGDVCGILLAEDLDLLAVNDKIVAVNFDVVLELSVYGIVLEHISEIIGIEKIVDTYNLDVFAEVLDCSAEYHTADAAKSVNTKFNHCFVVYKSLTNNIVLKGGANLSKIYVKSLSLRIYF